MEKTEVIDECIDCGRRMYNTDCRFFLCPQCREKEKRIPLWTEAYHRTPEVDKGSKKKFELYLESGEKASLEDVCNWWIKTYPADVFVNKPELIVEARNCLKHLLLMIHEPR